MSRINTNIQSLIATRILSQNNTALNRAMTRLSTGLRINSGRDDPAGLIASESLRSAKVAITAATDNARRADSVMAVAEGALQEVSSLLLDLEDLVDRTSNEGAVFDDEIAANQLQIDSILESINRLANSTTFGSKKLLNGALAFNTSSVSTTNLTSVDVTAAKITNNGFRDVVIEVVTGSEFAFVSAYGDDTQGTGMTTGVLSAAVSIEVSGNYGTQVFSFASGTTQAQMVTAINTSTQVTGVSAILSSNAGGINSVIFASTRFGEKGFVSVDVISNSGQVGLNLGGGLSEIRDEGVDGTIIINGQSARVDGLNASVRSASLAVELLLTQTFGTTDAGSTTFQITGGGAKFHIAPDAGLVGQESIGIKSITTGSLGDAAIAFLSSLGAGEANDLDSKNFVNAQRIVRAAIDQISSLRGRIGAFQRNTLGTAINSLQITFENIAAAESAIRDADFAVETSNLTRSQILVSSSTAILQLANAAPQNVLALLG